MSYRERWTKKPPSLDDWTWTKASAVDRFLIRLSWQAQREEHARNDCENYSTIRSSMNFDRPRGGKGTHSDPTADAAAKHELLLSRWRGELEKLESIRDECLAVARMADHDATRSANTFERVVMDYESDIRLHSYRGPQRARVLAALYEFLPPSHRNPLPTALWGDEQEATIE